MTEISVAHFGEREIGFDLTVELRLRLDHGPQRPLLQVRELRHYVTAREFTRAIRDWREALSDGPG